MRYSLAPDVRTLGHDGRVLLGGSPIRVVQLSPAGRATVARWFEAADRSSLSAGERGLLDRLVDAGIVVPRPAPGDGPFRAADLTAVVPVRDRAAQLDTTLAALASGLPVGHLLVVDDGSEDPVAVAEVAARHGADVVRRDVSGGPAAARNAALARVATPLVAFVDSDVVVTPGWLDPLLGLFGDERVALAAPRVTSPPGPSIRERYDSARAPLDLGAEPGPVRPRTRVAYVPSAAIVCRVAALEAVGGFDEAMAMGEDVDLCWRLDEAGWRCRYAGAESVVEHHDEPERGGWPAWWRRRRDYGTSAAPLDDRHPGAVSPLGISPWSAAVWGLVVTGHPGAAGAVAGGTAAAMVRKLDAIAPKVAVGVVLRGHLGAGELIARALVRPWFPFTLGAAAMSRRARRIALAAAIVPPLFDWWRRRPPVDPIRWTAVSLLDDVAYSTGVWAGALSGRSFGALRPILTSWPVRGEPSGRSVSAAPSPSS
jgi:mycofactocin system glycosyltransferase